MVTPANDGPSVDDATAANDGPPVNFSELFHYCSDEEFQGKKEKHNRHRRDKLETCLLCDKEILKMRNHLTSERKMNINPFFIKVLSTYYSTRKTKKCYQCNACNKRLASTYGHPENHEVIPLNDRDNLDYFPQQFRTGIISIRQTFAEKPTFKSINDSVAHQDAPLQDGECISTQRCSFGVKTFLTVAMNGTSGFTESSGLANVVRNYAHEKGLSKATVFHYLSTSSKFIDYLILHRSREYPSFSETRWRKVIKDYLTRIRSVGASHQQAKKFDLGHAD